MAADKAFRVGTNAFPAYLACEMLEEKTYTDFSVSRNLDPVEATASCAYREAFRGAWEALHSEAEPGAVFWPYPHLILIEELDMVACSVPDHIMRILEKSGAFTRARPHTKKLLRAAPGITGNGPALSGPQVYLWPGPSSQYIHPAVSQSNAESALGPQD
ncbi:hypothetical protein FRB90_004914 [Tulasnella sp. 427]|nr:hypothetical protein FRB90_004914 [Tulasnella sp. 427]